jgi:hypothetical protein
MPLDSASGRPRFSLFDKDENAAAAAVDSTSVVLSGLTIVPSAPLNASLGWEHVGVVGGCHTLLSGSTCASCSRGGVSISSALMEVSSLSSFSQFSAGSLFLGGVGVGVGLGGKDPWVPLGDCHAIGES